MIQLAGFRRLALGPGAGARVSFRLHADRTAFMGRDLRRIVEPGEIRVLVGASSGDIAEGSVRLRGTCERSRRPRPMTTGSAVPAAEHEPS